MTSATDVLRRMLDERGVEYQWTDKKHSVPSCEIVQWWSGDDVSAEYIEYHDGSTVLHIHASMLYATPEQAIAATLGRGTCTADETETISVRGDTCGYYFDKHFTIHVMECSECGHTYEHVWGNYEYCPHCGRRVVEVDA